MRDLLHKIKTLFKLARLVSSDTSGDIKKGTFFYMGSATEGLLFSPYGIMSNPPDGSGIMAFSQNGNEANQIGIAVNIEDIVEGSKDTDVVIGNPISKTFIHFKADGEMDIISPVKVNVIAPDIDLTADDTIKMTATDIELLSSTLTHNGVNIGEAHVHEQDPDSGTDTQQDTKVPK